MNSQYLGQTKQVSTNQNTSNAMGHLSMVQNLMRQADHDLQQYHKLIELFRQELKAMKHKIQNINDQIQDLTNGQITTLYRSLQLQIVNQKTQNVSFQDQLTQLKKQKSVLSQMINATDNRRKLLLQEVGQYS